MRWNPFGKWTWFEKAGFVIILLCLAIAAGIATALFKLFPGLGK